MKRFLLLFYGFLAMQISAQEVKTQKEILNIPKTDLVSDFNLKVGSGNVLPVTISKATYKDIGFSFVGHKFQYMKDDYGLEIHTFKDKKLLQSKTPYNYGNFMKPKGFTFNYTYASNGNLSKRVSTSSDSEYVDENFYIYSNNKIQQVRETGAFTDGKSMIKLES